MKFFRYVSVMFFCALTFFGCRSKEIGSRVEKPYVLSTTAMIDYLVGCIAQDQVAHKVLIEGDMDPHSYELVKGDYEKIFSSQILFYNGLGLEHGASLAESIRKHPFSVNIGGYIHSQKPDEIIITNQQVDPHIWMDMALWALGVDQIANSLGAVLPDHAELFQANARACKENMLKISMEIQNLLGEIPEQRRYLVTSHDAFHYFARRYLATEEEKESQAWRQRSAAPEGLAPEGQLSVSDIEWIIDYIMEHQVRVIFLESNVRDDPLRKVADSLKKKKYNIAISHKPLYGDALGSTSETDTYVKMMQSNGKNLYDSWK